MTTRTYLAGRELVIPDWPGTSREGSHFMRGNLITGRHSIGYGRASHNPKQGQGVQDSANEQARLYRQFTRDWGTVDIGVHLDPSASAGITASQARENFARAMEQVRTDPRVDVVWVLTSSRMSRGDIPFDELISTLITRGVLLAIGDSIYNPASLIDRETKLFPMYANDRTSTVAPRIASRNGTGRARREGRPISRPPYGLHRDHEQKPPWDVPNYDRPDGQPAADSPAAVVREIFRRAEAGDTLSSIAADLEARQVLTPYAAAGTRTKASGPFAWTEQSLRCILSNPAYYGKRRYKIKNEPDLVVKGHNIRPLITEAQYWSAQDAIKRRRTGRASAPRRPSASLLAGIAACGVCGTPLTTSSGEARADGSQSRTYTCRLRGHVSASQELLDDYVSGRIIAWLSDRGVAEQLAESSEDYRAEAELAMGEVARLQHQIDELRELGETNPAEYSPKETVREITRLQRRQQAAEQRARPPEIDPGLAAALGTDADARWDGLAPGKQRRLVSMIARVTLLRAPWAGGHRLSLAGRVGWAWKLATADGEPIGVPVDDGQPWVRARQARGERIAAWLSEQDGPRTAAQISAGLGEHVSIVREAVLPLVRAGRLARHRGYSPAGGPNTFFYAVNR